MALSTDTQENIDIAAILNAYTYLDIQIEDFTEGTWILSDIMDYIGITYLDSLEDEQREYYNIIKAAIDADESGMIGAIKLIDQSTYSGLELESGSSVYGTCQDDLIQACAFQVGDDVYVAYRGTGDGRWPDNAEGFTENSTNMQDASTAYFDYVVEKYGLSDSDVDFYVTGHSKGGNEAQYVMMTSKYREDINACYSFDGQGFSEAAIEQFKEQNPDYEERLQNMYSINGTNDFVHGLITPVIPEENTYYVDYIEDKDNVVGCKHALSYMIPDGKIMWQLDADGEVTNGEPGWLGKLTEEINNAILDLDEEDQAAVAAAIMQIMEMMEGEYRISMDGENASLEDFIALIEKGVPKAVMALADDATKWAYENWGEAGVIALVLVTVAAGAVLTTAEIFLEVCVTVRDVVNDILETAKVIYANYSKAAQKAWTTLKNFTNAVISAMQKVSDFISNAAYGYSYAESNPTIVINTGEMRMYASQIRNLSKRSKTLDSDMNSLYWQLGINWNTLSNLAKLLKGEIILDFACRLDACANYLEQTADDFDAAEMTVRSWFA